ncbi:nuclease-related domain-containing protein [Bacillus sp. FJAT-22090]|uniref:nuclease-related domain-containing protein n=1 Tax=Bacillus sp. FJAT-22090 TaxID=1581038 RepID=UPI0016432B7A|nr:nuclease-related domain-containing protein [Bacillus sp. FJAT-22090]
MSGHNALLKRVSNDQIGEFIMEEIRKKDAGIRGENRLMQKLGELKMAVPMKLFSNVSLALGEWKVQIDCLVVTNCCLIVLESKNYSDNLYVDEETEDFYKITRAGEEISLPNPYFQLMNHIRFVRTFFGKDFPDVQVAGAVIMTAKSSRIRKKPPHYPFYQLEGMNDKVIQFYNHFKAYKLSSSALQLIEQKLRADQTPFTYPPLCEHYHISPNEIITGVECPACGVLGMKRIATTWKCMVCMKSDRYAHVSTVNDYFSLIKKEITNKEFRRFCGVESKYAASRMLNSMDLEAHGSGPSRYFTQKKI